MPLAREDLDSNCPELASYTVAQMRAACLGQHRGRGGHGGIGDEAAASRSSRVASMQETASAKGYGYKVRRKKHGVDYYLWYCCLRELLLLMFDMPRNIRINRLTVLVSSALSPPRSREICQTSPQLRLKRSGPVSISSEPRVPTLVAVRQSLTS